MAQNYRDGLGRKVDTDSEVRSGRRLGGSNYARESVQDRKDSLQEQVCKPENIAREERKTDYPGTEPGHEVYFGKENPAIGKIASGPKVDVEDRSVERRCDFYKAEVEAGMRALEQDVGVGAPALDNLQQQSPYVQHNSKLDYKDGREGYGPGQERPLGADEQKSEPMREASEENVLAPFHKPQSVEEHHLQSNDPPKSPTFVEKIKDMLTSKPQTEATTNNIVDGEVTTNIAAGHGDEQPTSESSKKGVLEKIKEKLSQSP